MFNRSYSADAECAICLYGLAYSLGPFINHPLLNTDEYAAAHDASISAVSTIQRNPHISELETDLINTMSTRYAGSVDAQSVAYRTFADAMKVLHTKYSDNSDVAALTVEAIMVTYCDDNGYHFYDEQGNAKPEIKEGNTDLHSSHVNMCMMCACVYVCMIVVQPSACSSMCCQSMRIIHSLSICIYTLQVHTAHTLQNDVYLINAVGFCVYSYAHRAITGQLWTKWRW